VGGRSVKFLSQAASLKKPAVKKKATEKIKEGNCAERDESPSYVN